MFWLQRLRPNAAAFILSCVVSVLAPTSAFAEDNDQLYYAAKSAFSEPKTFEFRGGFGYDVSNPYLNVMSGHVAAFWLFDSSMAIGLEGTLYSSSVRATTEVLQERLAQHGDSLTVDRPNFSTIAVFRFTPISGLVNFFSKRILECDINLTARAGVVGYDRIGTGLLMGFGFETVVGVTPTFGFHAGVNWDVEKPGGVDWQWRSGFRFGPWVRF